MTALENLLSPEIVQKLGWTLLHFVWQATAVAILLAILLRVLRKSTANVRYILACSALALVVLLPVVTIQLVSISTPYAEQETEIGSQMIEGRLQMAELPSSVIGPPSSILEEPEQPETVGTKASWKQHTTELFEPALPYIVLAWLVGVFGLSVWHLGGWAQLQRLRRKMVKQVNASLQNKLKELADKLKVNRIVLLLESALVEVPTVVGWLKPVILLPASALIGLSTEQLEAMLAHELAHIKRYDYLVNMLQTVVEILGFYHPAVWWISHKIRVERENCCDDLAVSISGDKVRYARALTLMEEIRAGQAELAIAASGGSLFARICRLVGKDSASRRRASWIPFMVVILLVALLAAPATFMLTARAETKAISTPLHQAVAASDIERVKSLLSEGADVNAKDEQGQTALHAAVLQGRLDVTLLLAAHGADLNARDKKGRTALSYAATIGSRVAVLQQLLALGADPNIADVSGETPLHHGVRVIAPGGSSIVAELVAKGADINAKNNDGRTPAHVTAARTEGVGLGRLVELGANLNAKDKDGDSILHLFIEHATPEEKEIILAYDVNVNQANAKGQTPLHIASRVGHKKVLEGLIAKGANIDARDFGGHTALHIAAINGHMDIATILVDKGASINMKTKQGHTPAYLAVRSFHNMVADQLIKKGADISHICMASYVGDLPRVKDIIASGISVNTKDEEGFAPLHAAAAGGRNDVVEYLLSRGAEPKGQVQAGWTALGYAAVANHVATLELLCGKGIDAGSGLSKLLLIVAKWGDIEAAKCLIALGADVNVNDGAPLRNATRAGHKDMVELLIKNKANVNVDHHWPALSEAVDIDRPDIAACLIAAGADVDADKWTALMEVPYSCKGTAMAELLIKAGADVNKKTNGGWTALHSAAEKREDIARLLLGKGANPNARGHRGRTPLHEAAWFGPNVIKVLVDNGADVNARDAHGYTPLHFAYYYALRDSVQQLVAMGADINARTYSGETILHLAPSCSKGASVSADFIEFLLAQGADLKARDNSGWTPLHRAASFGKSEMVRVLLTHGADTNAKTNGGKTPSDLAKESGYKQIVELLRKHGAKD